MFFQNIILLVAVVIFGVSCQPCTKTFIVPAGDNCTYIIATSPPLTTAQFFKQNPLIYPNCTNLIAGQSVCVSVPGTCTTTYAVKSGDVCTSIAAKYNQTLAQLMVNNPAINKDCTNLQLGQVMCIVPPATATTVAATTAPPTPPADSTAPPTPPADTTQAPATSSPKVTAPLNNNGAMVGANVLFLGLVLRGLLVQ